MTLSRFKSNMQRWDDPPLWKFWLLASRLLHKAKSRLLARLFNAPGLYLGRGCVVRGIRRIAFGRNVYAHGNLWLEAVVRYRGRQFAPVIEIGDNVSLSDSVHITCIDCIILKSGILVGSKVYISDHNHGIYRGTGQSHPTEPPANRQLGGGGPVIIGENVWIGDNATILGPLLIGDGAIIASNSVVRQDVAPQTIVAGVPAKPIKRFDDTTRTWNRV